MRILLILFITLFTSIATAQDNVGRMVDGRAFRIDKEGMRVVDQLAELEVLNKELKSKVINLEDSVLEKNSLIQSLRAGVKIAPDDKLREQNLLGVTSSGLPKAKTDESIALQKSYDCQKEIEILKQEISKLQAENQRVSLEKSEVLSQIEVSKNETNTDESLNKLDSLKFANQELEEKLQVYNNKGSRGSLSLVKAFNPNPTVSSDQITNKKIKKILSAIQAKIMKRKNILDRLSEAKSGVSIKASSLKTKSGLSLDKLRHAVNSGSQGNETYFKLKEIESILDDDISTASRLKY